MKHELHDWDKHWDKPLATPMMKLSMAISAVLSLGMCSLVVWAIVRLVLKFT